MDKNGVAVIVVTPAVDDDLDRCLASLARQTLPPSEVMVVINGEASSAGRLEKWKAALNLQVMALGRNDGFAAPHALALPRLNSQWVAVLNADAVAEADWLQELSAAAQESADVGMVASAVLMAGNPERLESLGLEATRAGFSYLRKWGEPWSEQPAHEVFGPSGAAAMYRREMLDNVGFFDPDLFAYYEDLDLAWRARLAGWRCIAAPRARVHHKGSAHVSLIDKNALLQRNRLLVVVMNWPARLILCNILRIISWDLLSLLRTTYREKNLSAFRARWDFFKMLTAALKKRRSLTARSPGVEAWLVDDASRARARGYLP